MKEILYVNILTFVKLGAVKILRDLSIIIILMANVLVLEGNFIKEFARE